MQVAGWPGQAGEAVRPAAETTPAGAPSWGRVLATTISLWLSRRRQGRRAALLIMICALVLGVAAVAVFQFAGASSPAARAAPAARAHHQGRVARESAAAAGASGLAGPVAAVRPLAAAWVAGQLGSDETIGCDPLMCAALRAHGVAAGRLLPLGSAASSAPDTDVIVASPSALPWLGQDAPSLLASFGSGVGRIEVRAVFPGGAAAYQSAARDDLAARRSAGAQLLRSRRIEASGRQAAQIQAGAVDTRLLIMLALLASQHPLRVVAFGDGSPGVPLAEGPFRQVTIAITDSRGEAAAVAAALAMLHAQQAPYQPAQASTVRLVGGQTGLLIDFAAPGPLGLLSGNATG